MSILTHALKQEGSLVTATTDLYGDQVYVSSVSISCRFRYITQMDHFGNREELNTSNAIMWFEPDAPVEEGTILNIDGKFWRVDQLVKARRLSGSQIMFLKAFVKKHEIADIS